MVSMDICVLCLEFSSNGAEFLGCDALCDKKLQQSYVMNEVRHRRQHKTNHFHFIFRRKPYKPQFVPPYSRLLVEHANGRCLEPGKVPRALIFPAVVGYLGFSLGRWLTALCFAHVKLFISSLLAISKLQHLKMLCLHEVQVESESSFDGSMTNVLDVFGAWANSHLDSLGLSRVYNLLTKSICLPRNYSSNCFVKSPYKVCFSAQTLEITPYGRSNCVDCTYYDLASRNCTVHAHLMIYDRNPRYAEVNESGFEKILLQGRQSIQSLEIHCRLDHLPRKILSSLYALDSLRCLIINGTTKLLEAGELFWIARSCPLLETLRLGKSCRELPVDDYRSLSVFLRHLKELSLVKAQNLTRPVLTMIAMQNADLRCIYLEKCRKVGGLEFQVEGLVSLARHVPKLQQIQVIDCGRVTEEGINALLLHCEQLATLHVAGPEVRIAAMDNYISAPPVIVKVVGNKTFTLEQHQKLIVENKSYEDFKIFCPEKYSSFSKAPNVTEREKYSLEPLFNSCPLCNTVMIEF